MPLTLMKAKGAPRDRLQKGRFRDLTRGAGLSLTTAQSALDDNRGQIDLNTDSHVGHPQANPRTETLRPASACSNSQKAFEGSRGTPRHRRYRAELDRSTSAIGQPRLTDGIEKRSTGATPKQLHPAVMSSEACARPSPEAIGQTARY